MNTPTMTRPLGPSAPSNRSRAGDEELVERAKAGDEGAFHELVRRFTPRVHAVARGLLGSATDAEDVVQEVFWKVHRRLDSFREDSAFSTWLYRVTVNAATDWVKRKRIDRPTDPEDLQRTPGSRPEEASMEVLARNELREGIRRAIARLPRKFRDVLVLRELEGLSYQEIGQVLQCQKGTVESRLFRARARLREILERELPEDERR